LRFQSYEHGGNIYDYNRKLIDFSSNINPLGPPSWIEEIITRVDLSVYPDIRYRKLRSSIAGYLGCSPESVIVGNGITELIFLFVRAFKVKRPLIPSPTFCEYERAVILHGGKPKFLKIREEENFKLNVYEVIEKIPLVDALFLCNPNNPTGGIINKRELSLIVDAAKSLDIPVFVDEAFIEFVMDEKNYTAIDLIEKYDKLFVVRAITKFFALPGLRLGYGIAQATTINRLESYKEPWSVNSIAVEVGSRIFEDKKYIEESKIKVNELRENFMKALSHVNFLKVFPSSTNFILVKLLKDTSSEIKNRLLDRGFLIRDASNFRYLNKKFIRLAVRGEKENVLIVGAIRDILGGG
jgi:threonine-phosphate decarboxylase